MAYRCTLGHHGACAICDALVLPTGKGHIHEFSRSDNHTRVVCGLCYGDILRSANIILQAIRAAGLHYDSPEELGQILSNCVIVGIQRPLIVAPERSN